MDLMKMDDFFDDFLPIKRDSNMKCDIYEKDNKYFIRVKAKEPGIANIYLLD